MCFKRSVIALLLSMSQIVGCSVCCLQRQNRQNIRVCEVFADMLSEYRGDTGHHERVLCAKDVDEALGMFDEFILPTLEDKSHQRIRRLRSRIAARKSWMYCIDGKESATYYLVNLFPELRYGRYGFNYFTCNLSKATMKYEPIGENHGFMELTGSNMPGGESSHEDYAYEKCFAMFPKAIEEPEDVPPSWGFENCDVVAVVDVVDVQLMNVGDFNRVRMYATSSEECFADYAIRFDVRAEERGSVGADSLTLSIRRKWSNFGCGSWLYYRGMTLRVGLRNNASGYFLVRACPVLPYEPFSDKDVAVSGGFRIGADWKEMQEGRLSPLMVKYGNHTKAEFCHGEIVNCGQCGAFPDFGVTANVKVELTDESNKEYWEDAWFVEVDECYIYDAK